MLEYPETNAYRRGYAVAKRSFEIISEEGYRRGYAACRAEHGAQVVAWLEAQDMAFEAMLEACEAFAAERGDAVMMSSGLQYALRKAEAAIERAQAAKGAKA